MKLSLKIILPILLLLMVILGAFGYIFFNLKQQEVVIYEQTTKIQKLNSLNERLARQQEQTEHSVLDYKFNPNKALLSLISQTDFDESKILDEMSPFITTAKGRELINSYIDSKKEIVSLRNELIKAIDKGDKEQINLNHDKWDVQTENIKAALSDIKAYNINSLETTLATVNDIGNKITQVIIILAFIAIAAGILLYFYLRVIITVPIIKLVAIADQLARADFTTTTTTIGIDSNDEIGQLSRSFNTMSMKLKAYYAELEQKVRDRTQDLESSNIATRNILEDLKIEKEALDRSKAKDEAILASIGDGVFVVDDNLKIILINNMAVNLCGFSSIEKATGMIYTDVFKFVYEKKEEGAYKVNDSFIKETISTGQPKEMANRTILIRPDGTSISIADSAIPLKDKEGKVIGCVVVFRDVTRERQVDKMKTEFISLASHQLRTPLSAIKWFIELFQETKMDKEQTEYSKNISQSTERMIDLVNGLLNVSRIESGRITIDPKPTDLEDLAKEVIKELQPQIDGKEISLVFSADSNLPNINIDPNLIHEVYQNLITNSIKYTPKKGKITISVFRKDEDIVSEISDTGLGIPDNEKIKVFSKFYRGTNIIKVDPDGNGLGLYLAKSIMASSKGRIWYESTEGKGTTFWFSLPLSGTPPKEGEVILSS